MELEKYEQIETRKSSLKMMITFFFVFFLTAVFAVFIITSVLQINTVSYYIGSRLAQPAAKRALAMINAASFEKLASSLDKNDPYYGTAQKQLSSLREETNVDALYTMAQAEGSIFRYIIDGSAPDDEDFSDIGTEEDIQDWEREAMQTVTTKTSQIGRLDRSEIWGATISAYEPILNAAGDLVGIVGCDINGDDIVAWIQQQVLWQLVIVAALTATGLAVYLLLLRKVNKSFA